MSASENRHRKARQSLEIAMCFLANQARTRTIQVWTGLSPDRIRKLHREQTRTASRRVARPRGKSPQTAAYFWDTARIRQEAVWLASLMTLLGVIRPNQTTNEGRPFPDLGRAQRLCRAYEIYRSTIPSCQISFEHAVLLARLLWTARQIRLGTCSRCGALILLDPHASINQPTCAQCGQNNRHGFIHERLSCGIQASNGRPRTRS